MGKMTMGDSFRKCATCSNWNGSYNKTNNNGRIVESESYGYCKKRGHDTKATNQCSDYN